MTRSPDRLERKWRRPRILMAVLLVGGVLAAPPASAVAGSDIGPRGQVVHTSRTTGLNLGNSSTALSGNGVGGRSNGDRKQRPCWYEPLMSAEDMRRLQVRERKQAMDSGVDYPLDIRKFADKLDEKGMWWGVTYSANDLEGEVCAAGVQPYIWVLRGRTPPEP
ncbi:hypothetical protein [Microbispora sp. NBRC 16548]|uniref:hypothetical protein n=1 Tax=Microbispora sp. NBRC 16548 TaxID=3030994 RepID=UPI0025566591|nr:hypothetical protein [Microbispora sp. NBRC 16548]